MLLQYGVHDQNRDEKFTPLTHIISRVRRYWFWVLDTPNSLSLQ